MPDHNFHPTLKSPLGTSLEAKENLSPAQADWGIVNPFEQGQIGSGSPAGNDNQAHQGRETPMATRISRYDIHNIQNVKLAVNRETFDQVTDLSGFQFRPTGEHYLWDFQHSGSGHKGRLLHVEGFLGVPSIALQPNGQAYLVNLKGKTLALLFPGPPKRMKLVPAHHRTVPIEKFKGLPPGWPREIVEKVLRVRLRDLVLINEFFLLETAQQKQPAA